MRISSKGKYALKMLIDLAEYHDDSYISLADVSKRQNISKKYLEQIVPSLVRSGLIQANRGNKGGYRLHVQPEDCTVGVILRAVEGNFSMICDLDYENDSEIVFIWEELSYAINNYVDSISLQDIIMRHSDCLNYCI